MESLGRDLLINKCQRLNNNDSFKLQDDRNEQYTPPG